MHHFAYRNGVLHAEGVDLIALAEAVGTPFYCYASATLERHYNVFAGAFSGVGKTARELEQAVDAGILCVNVESEAELELLSAIAAAKSRSIDISIRV